MDALFQAVGHVPAAELRDRLHKCVAFLLGKEAARLHSIGQKHDFLLLEFAAGQAVLRGTAVVFNDIEAEAAQALDVAVQGFALHRDVELGEFLDELRGAEPMLVVGFLLEDTGKMKQFEFACNDFGHGLLFSIDSDTSLDSACDAGLDCIGR